MTANDVLEFSSVLLSMFGTPAVVFAIVALDERRLAPERLDRAWPPSTRLLAPLAFGPLCLPVHFWRTRRNTPGAVLGVLFGIAVVALNVGIVALLERILT